MPKKKEVKKLSKDLILAIDWAAAEYKYLEEFKEELKVVEQDKDIKNKLKDIKKASKLLHYVSKAERRAYHFEKNVGKRVFELLEEKDLSPDLIEGFHVFLKQVKIEEEQLVVFASWYSGELEKELDKEKTLLETKELLEEYYSEDKSKAERLHQELQQTIKHIEESIGDAEDWIRGLAVTLKKGKELLNKLPNDDKKYVFEEGMQILRKHGFPIDEYPQQTQFMAQHPNDLQELAEIAGEDDYLFSEGLPVVMDLITPEIWPWIVMLAEAAGDRAAILFTRHLNPIKDLITLETLPGMVKMAKTHNLMITSIFSSGLPAVRDLINEKTWPLFVDGLPRILKVVGRNFQLGSSLSNLKDLITPEKWPGIIKMTEAVGSKKIGVFKTKVIDLYKVLYNIKDLITSKTWPLFVEGLPRLYGDGKDSRSLTSHGILPVKDLLTPEKFPGLIKMAQAAGKNANDLFRYGLSSVKDIITPETWPIIVKKLPQIINHCKGAEEKTFKTLFELKPLFNQFGIGLFDLLIFPTLKRQSVASFLCFESFGKMDKSIQSKEDVDILIKILNKRKFKAHDFFEHILVKGLKEHVIASPISLEKEYLIPFLNNSPVDLLDIYIEYKNIITSDHPEKNLNLDKLFKNLRKIKNDVYEGVSTKDYDPKILTAVLYSTFSPELTVPRASYQQVFDNRTDREADIPHALHHLMEHKIKISLGGYALRDGETINDEGWKNLVEVVSEINQKGHKQIVPEFLGLQLLEAFLTKKLKKEQKEYLKLIYAFAKQLGTGLPEFNTEHSTLMKYKEFVGDGLRNDLITSLLDAAYTKSKEEFTQLINKVKKPKKMDGLAKQLFGLWMSNKDDKELRIKTILERNNMIVDNLDWQISSWQDIKTWLEQQAAGSISKDLINDIFAMLMGEDYNKMQHEMEKFEHSHQKTGKGGRELIFMLSKRKLHSVAMFNMGVCVAPDDKLWNMPDFWQMIIWDEFKEHAFGGVIFRTIEEQGKKYLILSIQPNGMILNEVSPVHLYDLIIKFSEKMRKKLKYDQILIPVAGSIHSNRGSIQSVITKNNYPKKSLLKDYEFSYSPYHYMYKEFFVVG
jgi:hypothetical protein